MCVCVCVLKDNATMVNKTQVCHYNVLVVDRAIWLESYSLVVGDSVCVCLCVCVKGHATVLVVDRASWFESYSLVVGDILYNVSRLEEFG